VIEGSVFHHQNHNMFEIFEALCHGFPYREPHYREMDIPGQWKKAWKKALVRNNTKSRPSG